MSKRKNFYDDDYIPYKDQKEKSDVNTGNPHEIFEYLTARVYKQDEYCKDAAMVLYQHAKGITSRNFVCGPAGSGKTYVYECIRDIWPDTVIVNAANISADGWSGGNKATDFLDRLDPSGKPAIVVFDEFDKLASPKFAKTGENVSASIQSEFLKMVEGDVITVGGRRGEPRRVFDTSKMSFVFCGSFSERALGIADTMNESGFGFGREKHIHKAYESRLTISDIIDAGVIPELASRATRLTNVVPLSVEDYKYLLTEHSGSPLKKLEQTYGMKFIIDDGKLEKIAVSAFESGLGVRNAAAALQRLIDDRIFATFDPDGHGEDAQDPDTLVL